PALLDYFTKAKKQKLMLPTNGGQAAARTLDGGTAYGLKALADELEELRQAPQGTRNDSLNRAAVKLFGLVQGNELDEGLVRRELEAAALAVGLTQAETLATLQSAGKAATPRSAPNTGAGASPMAGASAEAEADGPLPLRRSPGKQSAYPWECFLDFGPMLKRVSAATYTPLSMVGSVVLATMSLVVQEHYNVWTERFRKTPLSLWVMLIGDSSAGKSDLEAVFMQAIEDFHKQIEQQFKKEMEEYEFQMDAFRIDKEKLKKKAKTGAEYARSVQGMLPPIPPAKPYMTLTDFTYEGLYKHLENGRPAVGVFTAEGGKVFGGFGFSEENKIKTISSLSDVWSGKQLDRGRVSEGVGRLYGRRIASAIQLQPKLARETLTDEILANQGFMYRQLISWPEQTAKRFENINVANFPEVKTFQERVGLFLSLPVQKDPDTGGFIQKNIHLTDEALAEYGKFFDSLQDESLNGCPYEPVRGYALKTAEQALRIAGVLASFHFNFASEGAGTGRGPTITIREMTAGISLAAWYLDEVLRITLDETTSNEILQAEELLKWFRAKGIKATSVRQVLQFGPNVLREKKTVQRAFSVLEDHGWLTSIPEGAVVWMGEGKQSTARKAWKVVDEVQDR
ncbi:MAG: DUF3987 domain-containing protein, partial [Deltaproteobacteria bacterium]|nr:DUF3987 domain-containing protein [Deltaproteobacteria bacterium]